MILGTRGDENPIGTSGRTVWFTSPDLEHWTFEGDFWAPGLYTMHEMPDLFRAGDRWYLLTTEYSDRSKTVYRSSPSLDGPWTAPVDDAFDGRAYYAARSASDGERRYLFGWVATKEGDQDQGGWQWGGALVVHEVRPRSDGSLAVAIPESVRTVFGEGEQLVAAPMTIRAVRGRDAVAIGSLTGGAPALLSPRVSVGSARSFAIRLLGDDQGDGYAVTFRVGERRLDFDRVPNYPWARSDNRGLERPFELRPGRPLDVDLVIDDTIATIYADGVALNARMYDRPGNNIVIDAVDGEVTVERATLARMRGRRGVT